MSRVTNASRFPTQADTYRDFVWRRREKLSTFIFHGGYDSFVEEFYGFLLPLTELGFTVIGFDGPGQGGALRQGI
jgi:alpha-beta hydrolase superfamily lysophospholipase